MYDAIYSNAAMHVGYLGFECMNYVALHIFVTDFVMHLPARLLCDYVKALHCIFFLPGRPCRQLNVFDRN